MTADQIISMTASVAACLAAIATFLTVWQMVEQRRASYKPDLVIPRITFDAVAASDHHEVQELLDWREKANSNENAAAVGHGDFTLRVANIGLGAAKNVSATWSFPLENVIRHTNESAKNANLPIGLAFSNGIARLEEPQIASIWRNQIKDSVDFILPITTEREPFHLRLPHAYILAASTAIHVFYNSGTAAKEKSRDWQFPPINVALEFEDIGGDQYRAAYDIELNIHYIQSTGFGATLEPKRAH